MKTRAALLTGVGEKWLVDDVELGKPEPHDVIVEVRAAGLCHSDEHMATGDMVIPEEARLAMGLPSQFPLVGGHEGAGVVVEVGSAVERFQVGDHVATSFMPACGTCPSCASGRQYLCDLGFSLLQKADKPKHLWRGEGTNVYSNLGTFAEYALVHEFSLIKVEQHVPFEIAALLSCGIPTGWGAAVVRAQTQPGDVVAVIGVGGIGINAVQGAAAAGARVVIAIDPIGFKQEKAREFGATHTASSVGEALPLIQELSRGQLCHRVIVAPSVLYGDILSEALSITGKGSTCVAVGVAPFSQTHVPMALHDLVLWNKELKGTVFGSMNPRIAIPELLALYESGKLKIDELITRRYSLDEINNGYDDLRDGKILRGVVTV
ncbi:NDMA-dependent alcohol dehydrogenase [Mycobacterium branderi]|uniref:alcohol dehydrogenase n=1 Tax=Mycobacterium branderi TaxID=43348 RepID=A0A7I7WGE9_9MYCO|nr:NDMA-dependent alcohol dehydrogenase [Mycobacterium branderi]MCV7231737.1 NDMA-dependent alcohol dehydrogenase [Mycobacterium branderi]ORA40295.1 alcohol dehydrogenase [Mycobacterium branderi]BBZ15611.1 alcohol dehydrogenase [Mycobacterium branderi]